jgi:hypothetical protein
VSGRHASSDTVERPPSAPPGPSRLSRRRAARAAEREASREYRSDLVRFVASILAVVLVVAGLGYLALHLRGGRDHAATRTAVGRTQGTLLVQVRATDGSALASALLAHDTRARSGVGVLVPGGVIADIPSRGQGTFRQALSLSTDPKLSRDTLSDLMGVRVDDSWVLDGPTLSALVDRLGGITVDVDADVTATQGTRTVIVVPRGAGQRLTGAQALAYLGFRGAEEDEVQALPRTETVLDAVVAALPDRQQTATIVSALGAGSQATDAARVAALLTGLRSDLAAGRVSYQTLNVLPLDTGGGPVSYRLDTAGVTTLVHDYLSGSVLPGRGAKGNRVLVLNQVGTPGLGEKVRDRIVPGGFVFVRSMNQKPYGRTQTVILVPDATAAAQARGHQLAKTLGLPAAPVQVSPQAQSIADLIVVVGTDFGA